LALVVLSVVEQRLDAVRAVLAGATVIEVAAAAGVSRSTLHRWIGRYLAGNVAGLADRSHRPASCPHQAPAAVEVAVAEMRRKHPRWGSKRIRMQLLRMQLLRVPVPEVVVPSERTINRILLRHGLAQPRPRKRPKDSFIRFERPGPMQLWQVDIVGGLWLVNPVTGEAREAKIVTGVDDHSRFCVMAKVVERATARAVCVAFAEALARFGIPEEVQSDNGKQFTDRFGKGGEVMFDRICRKNGIKHRLTDPFSPNQNGKVERFHGTLRPTSSTRQRRSPRWPRPRRRSMRGWLTTTSTGRTRPSTTNSRSPRPTGSARSPTSSGSWSSCGCRPPWCRSRLRRPHPWAAPSRKRRPPLTPGWADRLSWT
jgi:transposase InsO family protein